MIFKITYHLKNLNVANKGEIDKFCVESNEEVNKLSRHWMFKKWKDYIKMIIFARSEGELSVYIPNPIKVPKKFMEQFMKKLKVEKNIEKWLKEHDYTEYEKITEIIK